MSKILFRSPKRDEVHQKQAELLPQYPKATCTETADEVILWDSEPNTAEREEALKDRAM